MTDERQAGLPNPRYGDEFMFGPEPMTPERAAYLRGYAEGASNGRDSWVDCVNKPGWQHPRGFEAECDGAVVGLGTADGDDPPDASHHLFPASVSPTTESLPAQEERLNVELDESRLGAALIRLRAVVVKESWPVGWEPISVPTLAAEYRALGDESKEEGAG